MAVKVPCANTFVRVQGYNLNVTLRDYPGSELLLQQGEDIPETMAMLETLTGIVEATIKDWLVVTSWLGGETVGGTANRPN